MFPSGVQSCFIIVVCDEYCDDLRVNSCFTLVQTGQVVMPADISSGSGCSGSLDLAVPLSKPLPLSTLQKAGLILTPLDQCQGTGCITGWSYCYYSLSEGRQQSVAATFSLWRHFGEGLLKEVKESRFEVTLKALQEEQWLVCEERDVHNGCGVRLEPDDLVGVTIDQGTALSVVGEQEGQLVLVGEREDGVEGRVTNSSLVSLPGRTLLVFPLIGWLNCSYVHDNNVPLSSLQIRPPAVRSCLQ